MADRIQRSAPIRIVVAGRELATWTSLDVGRSVLALSGGLDLELPAMSPRPFDPGAPIQVFWGDQPVLDGYVDSIERSLGSGISVQARDKSGDLNDASPDPDGTLEWTEQKLPTIVREICRPFGIRVGMTSTPKILNDMRVFGLFKVELGETAYSTIERAMVATGGLLVYSTGDGGLQIAPPDDTLSTLVLAEGLNVIGATYRDAREGRHSVYVVLGQSDGGEETGSVAASESFGSAADAAVTRFRPLVVLSEVQLTRADAEVRAQWEAAVRAARGRTVTIDVAAWDVDSSFDPRARLWRQNQLHQVHLPRLGISGPLLVESIRYRSSKSGGTTASMTMVRRDAFIPDPTLPLDGEEAFDAEEEGE